MNMTCSSVSINMKKGIIGKVKSTTIFVLRCHRRMCISLIRSMIMIHDVTIWIGRIQHNHHVLGNFVVKHGIEAWLHGHFTVKELGDLSYTRKTTSTVLFLVQK